MTKTYYRFKRDLEGGGHPDCQEWWRTDSSKPEGEQVAFSVDDGVNWSASILPTVDLFLWDIGDDAVQVDPPAAESRGDGEPSE